MAVQHLCGVGKTQPKAGLPDTCAWRVRHPADKPDIAIARGVHGDRIASALSQTKRFRDLNSSARHRARKQVWHVCSISFRDAKQRGC